MKYHLDDMLAKAKERGYTIHAQSSDRTWYSFMLENRPINLQLYVDTEEFKLTHIRGILRITTDKCGSFMMDSHFNRIEKEMRKIVFDLL